jgi:hypothetical protein
MMTDQYRPGEVGIEMEGFDGHADLVGSIVWLKLGFWLILGLLLSLGLSLK